MIINQPDPTQKNASSNPEKIEAMPAMKKLYLLLFAVLLVATQSCQPAGPRAYEGEAYSLTIPAGWETYEETWGREIQAGKEYYGLGVQTAFTMQSPPGKGQGKAFFSVATAPLEAGEDLAARFERAYQEPVTELEDVVKGPYSRGDLSGFVINYRRPWGEPWWRFNDIWLEQDGVVYVLSFHTSPNGYDPAVGMMEEIVGSFHFKE